MKLKPSTSNTKLGVPCNRPLLPYMGTAGGSPATAFSPEEETKRFFIAELDSNREPTGKRFPVRFTRRSVSFLCYDVSITFSKSNRGQSYRDSRLPIGRLTPESEAFSELRRLLPAEQAEAAIAYLKNCE